MVIKNREPHRGTMKQLTELLTANANGSSPRKKFLIERELRNLDPGENGGYSAAHFINFYCADSPYWAIIHDLRIENNGCATHFDHVLINRFFDIYLLDSKNYSYSLKITADGEFLVFDGRQYQSIDSPIEENEKRIRSIEEALRENKILPKRMGIPIWPKIESYVVVSPKSNVLRPPDHIYDTRSVVPADVLTKTLLRQIERIKRTVERIKRLPRAFKIDVLTTAASKLASLNKPVAIDYCALFGLEDGNHLQFSETATQDPSSACDYAI